MKRRVVLVACLMLCSCAGMDVGPVANDETGRGIRYYQTAPFLFVRSDGKGGLTSEIVYLPDTTLLMSIRPYAYMASNDATLTFTNGTLDEAKMVGDETVVPMAMLDAISKAAAAAVAADMIANGTQHAQAPVPYLFRILVRNSSVTLRGGPALGFDGKKAVIQVTVVPPEPSK